METIIQLFNATMFLGMFMVWFTFACETMNWVRGEMFEDESECVIVEEPNTPMVIVREINPIVRARQVRMEAEAVLNNSIAKFHARISKMECALAKNLITNSKYTIVYEVAGEGVIMGEGEPMVLVRSPIPTTKKGWWVHMDGTVRNQQGKRVSLKEQAKALKELAA